MYFARRVEDQLGFFIFKGFKLPGKREKSQIFRKISRTAIPGGNLGPTYFDQCIELSKSCRFQDIAVQKLRILFILQF